MAALNDTPLANLQMNVTAPDIAANWPLIRAAFEVDHYWFAAENNKAGKHLPIHIPNIDADPAAQHINSGTLYTSGQSSPITGPMELMLYMERFTPLRQPIQVISLSQYGTEVVGAGMRGWFFLPSGLLVKFGRTVLPSNYTRGINIQLNRKAVDPASNEPNMALPKNATTSTFVAMAAPVGQSGKAQTGVVVTPPTSGTIRSPVFIIGDRTGAGLSAGQTVYWMIMGQAQILAQGV